MFVMVPLQVEDAAVDRLPVVSIGIAVLCAVAFAATWLFSSADERVRNEAQEVVSYYRDHAYLTLPPVFSERYLNPRTRKAFEKLHSEAERKTYVVGALRDDEQSYLDALETRLTIEEELAPMRRYALVPSRGVAQVGWLSYMFLHFGWMHLLGNLLFFYLTGPLLEDLWGRRFFAGFYLLGGLIAGIAQVLLERHSGISIAGASGAIAACMGAFSHRFAGRRVRMGYLIFLLVRFARGTFLVPAWLWGLVWFGGQVLSLALGSSGGVAVFAHIGGFAFGFLFAMLLHSSGYEENTLRPSVERATTFHARELAPDHQERAMLATARGDAQEAGDAFRNILISKPDDRAALLGLAKLELESGDAFRGMRRIEKVLLAMLQAGQGSEAWELVTRLPTQTVLEKLGPRTAQLLVAAREHAPYFATELIAQLEQLAATAPAPAPGRPASFSGLPATGHTSAGLRIIPCSLVSLDAESITVEADSGHQRTISRSRLVGVASALLPLPDGGGNLVITDLILRFADFSGPAQVLRIPGAKLSLAKLFPTLAPRLAHQQLLRELLSAEQVRALPDRASLEAGRYLAFASPAKLDEAFYPDPDLQLATS